MLRIFRGVVRFFEWLRRLDDQLEAVWLSRRWPEFLKWWIGGSLAIGLFAFLLICIPGAILLEANRLYSLLKGTGAPAASATYAGLANFAVTFAAVTLTMALVTCPFFMLQVRRRGK